MSDTTTVTRLDGRGMITLRGDLASAALAAAVKGAVGTAMPAANAALFKDGRGACWMSPDELLLMVPADAAAATVAELDAGLGDQHHLAVDVSDARAVFRIAGTGAGPRETLAKLTPADMSAAAFAAGSFRRSRVAQAPAAFWMTDDGAIELVCFRSVADYVAGILAVSAEPAGAVGFF